MQTNPLDISVSARRSSYLRPGKIESLEIEHDYLYLLRTRHLQWRSDTNDHEICRMHREIVDSINRMIDQFGILLEAQQGLLDKE